MSEKKERIILDAAFQPQVRTDRDTKRLMLDVIIALMPALLVAVLQFGANVLIVVSCSVASAVFWEWLYRKLLKKPQAEAGSRKAGQTGTVLRSRAEKMHRSRAVVFSGRCCGTHSPIWFR